MDCFVHGGKPVELQGNVINISNNRASNSLMNRQPYGLLAAKEDTKAER